MRFFYDQTTNTIRSVERYSKSADIDQLATSFLNEIDKVFKQYLFSNTELVVFELKNKDEFTRLNTIRIAFINFLCQTRMIHPSQFVESDTLKNRIVEIFSSNSDVIYAGLISKARELVATNITVLVDSDPKTS